MKALVYITVITMFLSACAGRQDSFEANYKMSVPPAAKPNAGPQPQVQKNWMPAEIRLTCRLGNCPQAIGALIFLRQVQDGWATSRCTAFLISSTQVMTAGHCDMGFEKAPAVFITQSDLPGPSLHTIAKSDFKVFTKNTQDDRKTSGLPDVAIYRLDQPVEGVAPLPVVQGSAVPTITSLRAYEVNETKPMEFVIDAADCSVHRHERYFPFALSELPQMLTVFDCPGEEGNSGSPLLNPAGQVEAVLAGGLDGHVASKEIGQKDHRSAQAFEAHNVVTATNLRCLQIGNQPAPQCADTSDEVKQKRFLEVENRTISDSIEKRVADESSPYFLFKPVTNQLQAPRDIGLEMELVDYPKCRKGDVPAQFELPSEHLRLTFDEWATPRLEPAGERRTSKVTVKARLGDIYTLQVNWATPYGGAMDSKSDPRSALGDSFSIALPLCPR